MIEGDRGHGSCGPPSGSRRRPRCLAGPEHRLHPAAAALPGPGHDRPRVARRAPPGVGGHHRPPGAPGAARPAVDAAGPGLRARPHVHVGLLHRRLGPAPRGHHRACWRPSTRRSSLLAVVRPPDGASLGRRPARLERDAEEARASGKRLASHLFTDGHHGAAGQGGAGHRHRRPRLGRAATSRWERWYVPVARERWIPRSWNTPAWALFGAGYVGAVVFVASGLDRPPATSSSCWPRARGCRRTSAPPSARSGSCAASGWTARRRLAWLEDYAAALGRTADLPVPGRLDQGITLDARELRLPGHRPARAQDVSLHLPAGAVVAVVGENGAGKTTLVKLLSKLYEPTAGRILVDGADLGRMPPTSGGTGWPAPSRTSSASSCRRGRASGWATCRASTTSRPCVTAVGPGRCRRRRRPPRRRPRHAARAHVARRASR